MQKPEIIYLIVQSTYTQIEIALFKSQDKLACQTVSKLTASSKLIPTIKSILDAQKLALNELTFIGANLGPAPFTTLRTTITTVNGLGYATGLPLIGVDGLSAFTKTILPTSAQVVVLWNAFGDSAYYGIRHASNVEIGWAPLNHLLPKLIQTFQLESAIVCGEGIANFDAALKSLPSNFTIDLLTTGFPSIDLIAQIAWQQYLVGQASSNLTPLYLKQAEPFTTI